MDKLKTGTTDVEYCKFDQNGQVCGLPFSFEIVDELNQLYRNRLVTENPEQRMQTMEEWIKDLLDQNAALVKLAQELENESIKRVDIVERMQHMTESGDGELTRMIAALNEEAMGPASRSRVKRGSKESVDTMSRRRNESVSPDRKEVQRDGDGAPSRRVKRARNDDYEEDGQSRGTRRHLREEASDEKGIRFTETRKKYDRERTPHPKVLERKPRQPEPVDTEESKTFHKRGQETGYSSERKMILPTIHEETSSDIGSKSSEKELISGDFDKIDSKSERFVEITGSDYRHDRRQRVGKEASTDSASTGSRSPGREQSRHSGDHEMDSERPLRRDPLSRLQETESHHEIIPVKSRHRRHLDFDEPERDTTAGLKTRKPPRPMEPPKFKRSHYRREGHESPPSHPDEESPSSVRLFSRSVIGGGEFHPRVTRKPLRTVVSQDFDIEAQRDRRRRRSRDVDSPSQVCNCNCSKNDTQSKISSLKSDVKALLEVIRRSREHNSTSLCGLSFKTITYEDIFGAPPSQAGLTCDQIQSGQCSGGPECSAQSQFPRNKETNKRTFVRSIELHK